MQCDAGQLLSKQLVQHHKSIPGIMFHGALEEQVNVLEHTLPVSVDREVVLLAVVVLLALVKDVICDDGDGCTVLVVVCEDVLSEEVVEGDDEDSNFEVVDDVNADIVTDWLNVELLVVVDADIPLSIISMSAQLTKFSCFP